MASSSQIRSWWSAYECATAKMVRVAFPGPNGPTQWSLLVADKSAPIWVAVAQIMVSEPYLFRETAGGTYNCRPPSLHAYGLALDINPSKNPYDCPMVTDMPDTFITRMEGIRANGKQAIQWGGRWPCENPPDPMHFQINVAPADCTNVVWDTGDNGDDMALTEKEENTVRDLLAALENNGAGTQASRQGYLDKMVKIGKNYPVEPTSGSSDGLKRGDTVQLT